MSVGELDISVQWGMGFYDSILWAFQSRESCVVTQVTQNHRVEMVRMTDSPTFHVELAVSSMAKREVLMFYTVVL